MTNIAGAGKNDLLSGYDGLIPSPNLDAPSQPSAARTLALATPTGAPGPDAELTARAFGDLLHWEGDIKHLYVDTRGFVTTGIGQLVKDAPAARELPFIDTRTGAPATPQQIDQAFASVQQLPKGHSDSWYAKATDLRLPEETVRALAQSRLTNEFLPGLRRELPHFDSYPPSAQRALIDMAYNLGVGGVGRFHGLRAACEAGDWSQAAAECHRRTCRAERNDWTRGLFLQAGIEAAQ
jgi:GH24 family phage-related lysozyme (muramidase)